MVEDVSWILSETQILGIRCGRRIIMGTPIYRALMTNNIGLRITLIKEVYCALIENYESIYRCSDERTFWHNPTIS